MKNRKFSLVFTLTLILGLSGLLPVTITANDYGAAYEHNLRMRARMRAHFGDGTDKATLELYKLPRYGLMEHDKEILELAKSIVKGISSEYDKVKAIHDWVTENIWYDDNATIEDSDNILQTKRAVCESYARLTVDLLKAAGIPAKYISGAVIGSRGFDDILNENVFMWTGSGIGIHAWCEAYADGRWIIMDPTWNSDNGYSNGRYSKQKPGRHDYFDISLEDISSSHKYTGYGHFSNITDTITIPTSFTSIGKHAFNAGWERSVLMDAGRHIKTVNIPRSIKEIGEHAFNNLVTLEEINIATGLLRIGEGAFSSCSSLTKINIPDSVTSIGGGAFYECKNLVNINIPDSVTSLEAGAFIQSGLVSITLPSSITAVERMMFFYCENLMFVEIPDSITTIEDEAFYYCKSLTDITIPRSVTSISSTAFFGCDNLTIYGETGSYAETYAKSNNIQFSTGSPSNTSIVIIFTLDKTDYILNGVKDTIDAAPVSIHGRTVLPIRYVAEPLGATVSWDEVEQKITVTHGNTVIELWLGNNTARLNGNYVPIDPENPDIKPMIINSRSMLPLRFVAEALSCDVEYLADSREIRVNYPK